MANEDNYDQEPESDRLGSWEVQSNGESLTARITGDGVFTTGHSRDSSFLSDRRLSSRFEKPGKWLGLDNIFPEDWTDKSVEFEITVRAKRIPDSQRGK